MRIYQWVLGLGILAVCASTGCAAPTYKSSLVQPPFVPREFRAAWVATVDNIDWPSKKDLSSAQQKAELLSLIQRAAGLKLNALILQVRPQCDAIYPSPLEPWSEFLTGEMGRAPAPAWDPLAFAVEECHRRGLELHAWFNPYRALHPAAKGPVAASHVSQTRPELVRSYGKYLWLDPGERAVQDYSLAVVRDVLKRYDVDGIHFDDYFYPYKEKVNGQDLDFPDDPSWKKFGAASGLSRDDWRRDNVNQFVARVQQSIRATKPWVKFGISPFGIWRPGNPPQIKGFDAYEKLYADARKWLQEGTVDYFVPQLYWPIGQKDQSFPVLLDWWNAQNPQQRHVWPGLATYKVETWKPSEILEQVKLSKHQSVSAGHVHYSLRPLLRANALQQELTAGPYATPALVPPSPWLGGGKPGKPALNAGKSSGSGAKFNWTPPAGEMVRRWLVQYRTSGEWRTEVTLETARQFPTAPEVIAVTAIGRNGVAGPAAVLERK